MAGGFKNIFISNQQRQVKLDKAWLQTLLGRIVAKTKYSDWELYCRLVGPKRMTLLNKQLRGKETTTDILSLPLHAAVKPGVLPAPMTPELKVLGELIIYPGYFCDTGGEREAWLRHICVHGVCHLLGYDHEEEKAWAQMRRKERSILTQLRNSMFQLSTEALITLDHAFLKLPLEQLKKALKTQQRFCTKELFTVLTLLRDAPSEQSLLKLLNKLKALQKKLREIEKLETEVAVRQTSARLVHLEQLCQVGSIGKCEVWREWTIQRMNRLLVDYLCRQGMLKTAKALAMETGVMELVEFDFYKKIKNISDSLTKEHSCQSCLAWCETNKAALKKVNSPLEFELRLQEFIQLSRQRKLVEAVSYARLHFPPIVHECPAYLPLIRTAMTLLAYPSNTSCPPYQALYSSQRWWLLKNLFLSAHSDIHGLPSEPLLLTAVRAGLSSLKTIDCGSPSGLNKCCPVCDGPLRPLAKRLPRAHHVVSAILCRVSGLRIGGDEVAGIGPSGYVYAWRVFEEACRAHSNGLFIDPRSGESYSLDQVKRIFIT